MNLRDPKIIILIGMAFFAIAFIDSLTVSYYNYDCWFRCMHLVGKVATVGVAASLVWVIFVTVVKTK